MKKALFYIKSRLNWLNWIVPLALIGVSLNNALPVPGCPLSADSYLQSGEYCYRMRVTVSSTKTSQLTDYPVRINLNALSLVQGGFTKPEGWDLRPFNISLQDTAVTAQEMSETTSYWWLDIDAIASDGFTPVNWSGWLYTGNPYILRDQGVSLIGTDVISVPDHSDLDITDDLQIDVTASVLVATGQTNAGWVDKLDTTAKTGYWFGYDNGNVTAKVGDGSTIDTLSVAWDGAEARFRMTYDSGATNKLVIEKFNNSTSSWDSVATGGSNNSISTNALNMKIGSSYTGAIYQVALLDNVGTASYAKVVEYGFNPQDMDETSAVNPLYGGTIKNLLSSSHTATYSFNRDQSDFSFSVGPIMPIFSDPAESVPEQLSNVLGDPTQTNLFATSPTNVNMPFYTSLNSSAVAMGIPMNAFWILFFGGISGFLAIAV